ncbi:2-oxoglutarate dehydrogenase E1 component [Guptibacillus hwajinpoensis]|uniref:2-oxoglutarate dehydrogenase E1 component n=1 Tax=Guptibacillus hwajinpoensis TaxID=208199 RepID=A0ABU0K1D4_9BACL|nr:2-oxoglutarate dehydrogenase E1 component [Alkalihalobacillus hemicentroti]MDQ0483168.1 2-oxoglutarate dehydrogenase E1 component [Alkalihalobacillus hemicentroti]
MNTKQSRVEHPWQEFYGPNLGYAIELYEMYQEDPESVDPDMRQKFEQWGPPPSSTDEIETSAKPGNLKKVISAVKLADNIRTYGHLAAAINPLNNEKSDQKFMNPEKYGLSSEDLKAIPAEVVWENAPADINNGLQAIKRLQDLYTKSLSYEFTHVHAEDERKWLDEMVENDSVSRTLTDDDRKELLRRLTEVEGFEKFLHKTFVGQKRFSIEGVDAMVPMLDDVIKCGTSDGAKNVMIGMAHRGRLNVLTHVLNKPYEKIFAEFHHAPNKELVPSEGSTGINYGWTGDVKYHMGADRKFEGSETAEATVTLANNPSHLEFVDPVVEGYARAAQETRDNKGEPKQDFRKSFAILIHGDAAFPGEGVVAETLNLSQLKGYHTGGTIHIIANNQLGFTTESSDSRSTKYASDLAKGYEIPIVHVNADDPEACLAAMHLAYEYRMKFNKDFLIDLIGYRRFGHNEMDDPAVTQPHLYEKIKNHPTVRASYAKYLTDQNVIESGHGEKIDEEVLQELQTEYDKIAKGGDNQGDVQELQPPKEIVKGIPSIDTSVPLETLKDINEKLLIRPDGFNVYPKLERILKRRLDMLEEGGKVDWALGETLAFASILGDGTPIRITGQDSQRGTFAQRHLVLHDKETGEKYCPLHELPQAESSFAIHNSPLSEASVVGFEYGYNVFAPETLVIWEAQYGDFANAAQVIFDQFVSAGRAKWGQKSGMVLLLPHGYEGQGPEHSSGRVERFLTLAAENNWTVANLTSAAQYFHILRRQAAILEKKEVRPLVIMTPKSLLRNQRTSSPGFEFSQGQFLNVVEQAGLGESKEKVERIVLCTGKVAVDLSAEIESSEENFDWLHVLRVEQLYPFPHEEVKKIFERYSNVKEIIWLQEEPKNMGSWNYISPRIHESAPKGVAVSYVGRPDRSSPAGGEPNVHKKDQERIIQEVLEPSKTVSHQGGNRRD